MSVSLDTSLAAVWVLMFEVPILTSARFWVMRHNTRTPARKTSDAFFFLFSLLVVLCGVLLFINIYSEKRLGYAAITEVYMKNVFAIGMLYTIQMWSIKAAFLALYFDLKSHLSKKMLMLLYFTAGWLVFTFLGNFLFQMLYCRPFESYWKVGPGSCSSIMSAPGTIVSSGTNITGDIAILVIGLMIISNLRVSRRERYAMVVVTLVGVTSIVTTLIRFVMCYRMALAQAEAAPELIYAINTWSMLEVLTVHIAFCMLAFKSLLNRRKGSKETQNHSGSWSQGGKGGSGIHVSHSIDVESLKSGSDTELTQSSRSAVFIGRG